MPTAALQDPRYTNWPVTDAAACCAQYLALYSPPLTGVTNCTAQFSAVVALVAALLAEVDASLAFVVAVLALVEALLA